MANYRPIFTKIWDDPHFAELSLEEQHIFLYLLTNSNTTESGIYPISPTIIARNAKVPVEKVKEAFNNPVFQHMVLYDDENKVVFIKKFLKYNARGNPKLLRKAILNDIKNIYTNLWLEFIKLYPEFTEDIANTYPSLSKDLPKSLPSVSKDLDNTLQTLTAKPKPKPKPKPIPKPNPKPKPNNKVNGVTANAVTCPQQVEDVCSSCPHQEIIKLYHEILPELPKVKIWTEQRQKHLRARWRESAERQNLDWWEQFFKYVRESDFLMGRVVSKNGRTFQVDLEWLIRPRNFVKVIEGRYHNRSPADYSATTMQNLTSIQEWLKEKGAKNEGKG